MVIIMAKFACYCRVEQLVLLGVTMIKIQKLNFSKDSHIISSSNQGVLTCSRE